MRVTPQTNAINPNRAAGCNAARRPDWTGVNRYDGATAIACKATGMGYHKVDVGGLRDSRGNKVRTFEIGAREGRRAQEIGRTAIPQKGVFFS